MLTFIVALVACLALPAIMIPALIGFAIAGTVGGIAGAVIGLVVMS